MAPSSDVGEPNDAASSDSLTEDTTATKKRSLNSFTGTLTSPSSSSTGTLKPQSSYSIVTLTLPSSSRDFLHIPSPPLPTLPFELIVEILSKLPVKSLMQFQCVCKSWKSLISDPNFAKKHLRMSTKHH
ncbi:F-box/kelch-repeat protein, partial [Trifolium medium]|nr:F-box/kelch-repeat protein [Trifolium medium]